MAGIYIHIPFCRQKCLYCDFYAVASQSKRALLVDSIIEEIDCQKEFLKGLPVSTIYFGGGTPSTLTRDELSRILSKLYQLFNINTTAEITLEANPEDLTPDNLASLRSVGINRLSVGIQSFVDEHLLYFGRRHSAKEAIEAIKNARSAGFLNISADLIYGFPGLTAEQWKSNVETMVGLQVDHISSYQLMVEQGSVFFKRQQIGRFTPVDDDESAENYRILTTNLRENGYDHYELSNFCKPGLFSRHNSSYWFGEPYLGLGPSAHSFNGVNRQWNVSSIDKYCQAIKDKGVWWEEEILTERDKYNELIITRLRTKRGLQNEEIATFSDSRQKQFLRAVGKMESKGQLSRTQTGWIIPENVWLVSDGIISELIEI